MAIRFTIDSFHKFFFIRRRNDLFFSEIDRFSPDTFWNSCWCGLSSANSNRFSLFFSSQLERSYFKLCGSYTLGLNLTKYQWLKVTFLARMCLDTQSLRGLKKFAKFFSVTRILWNFNTYIQYTPRIIPGFDSSVLCK